MLSFEAKIARIYDLTIASNMKAMGLTISDLVPTPDAADDAGHDVCQQVARDIRDQGFEAIKYPSATGRGKNMAIFVDQLSPSSTLQLVPIIETIAVEAVESLLKEIS
jgi:hypothetical protein